jgi:hypothetical protein
MKLTPIANGDCGRDDCPAIYTTDRETAVIRGNVVDMKAGPHEAVVEIPLTMLWEATRALGR